ncbi:hypothetical protein DFH07DRAFT_1066487 [Mycena maculata]|uniref:Uncharacterized protein n=1 Tax=Mycena maculata TaxID=230809 RepID=A0AAD7HV53_9AGAR|nr:hypothetical protein DFH07DRAFT_1066487 [Mycena maculata]
MPALPSRATLEEMKRPDLQKLCKDYGVKANLKTDALIELLLDTKKANPRTAAPPTRRSVSTRHTSRSAPRISSVIIHDTDDEEDDDNEPEIDEEETENKPQPVEPEPIPATTRTRKAKETQTRLGVGRPVAAGGNGPRAVTKSISVAKGKRGKNSKAIKPVEDTIPEEVEEEQPPQAGPSDLTIAGPFTALEAFDPAAQDLQVHEASASETSAVLSGAIVDAIRQQLQTLKSELDQIPILKAELAQLRKQVADMQHLEHKVITLTAQVDTLTAQSVTVTALDAELKQLKAAGMVATSSRIPPNPSTPRFQSPVPRPSSAYGNASSVNASSSDGKTVSPIKNHDLPDPGIAPSMLGKRHRESTSSNLTGVIEEGQEGDLSEDELAKRVIRPTKKRARLQEEDEHDFVVAEDPDLQSAPRVPSFTVFSGEEEEPFIDPPPPTESLPEFYVPSSPTGSGSRQGTTTSTQNASENQHPFTFAFLPISSTPVNSAFNLPSFPYPEAPTSPSPAGPAHNGPSRNHGERTDIFESFGLPPPGRPRSRVTSTSAGSAASRDHATGSMGVDPAALTQRPTDREREAAAAGFGFVRPLSASDDDGDAPGLKRAYGTMYGTELEGDTRFGDFGLEGVATGFWASGRF